MIDFSVEEQEHLYEIKNHLHQNPEPSWKEYDTTAYLKAQMLALPGIELVQTKLQTGFVALLRGGKPGSTVALRTDIDAIPMVEEWQSPIMSQREGFAHGCGHDFHATAMIGAATLLSHERENLSGNVIFIFQPAEETTNGAKEVIAEGIFETFGVKSIFGLHTRPEVETGKVVVQAGPMMAAKVNFNITIHGVGGHGSMPHKCVDPILCGAAIVQNVLTIPSRNIDPLQAIVLSICSFHGGTPENLIVDKVELTGSLRYLEPSVGERAMQRLRTVIDSTAATFECSADLTIVESVHSVLNASELLPIATKAATSALGPASIVTSDPALATEDFAEYMQKVPGFFYWLGTRAKGEACYSWHNTKFHTDDAALPGAARLMAQSALVSLQNL